MTTIRGPRTTAAIYDYTGAFWTLAQPHFALPDGALLVDYDGHCSVLGETCKMNVAYDTYELRARAADQTVRAALQQTVRLATIA